YSDSLPSALYTLSLHDALPISPNRGFSSKTDILPSPVTRTSQSIMATCFASSESRPPSASSSGNSTVTALSVSPARIPSFFLTRSEEHTSELQSRENLVCRLLL